MLSGTLLDNDKHGALKAAAAANTGLSRPGAALERASTGFRRYATLRAAAFGNGAGAEAAAPADDNRGAFEDARSAVAEAAGHVTQDIPDELIAAIEDLLEPGSAGAGVVRAYWADLGFPEAEVDAYLAEAGAARAGLGDVARLVQTVDDWRAPSSTSAPTTRMTCSGDSGSPSSPRSTTMPGLSWPPHGGPALPRPST